MIFHLTPTNSIVDNRILKEVGYLYVEEFPITCVGISDAPKICFRNNVEHVLFRDRFVGLRARQLRLPLRLAYFNFRMFYFLLVKKILIVHVHDAFFIPAVIMLRFFKDFKVVYDAHELESDKNGQGFLDKLVTVTLEKLLWPKIDYFITVSFSIQNWYFERYGQKKSSVVLNIPVRSRTTPTARFIDLFPSTTGRNFIYVGELAEGRFIEELLLAFETSEADLYILGFGNYESKVRSASHAKDNIHFHEKIVHDSVTGFIEGMHVGLVAVGDVSLSDRYCLPNKLFEYAQAGIYVLANDLPEIRSYLERHSLGECVRFENSVELLEAIATIDTSKDRNILLTDEWEAQMVDLNKFYKNVWNRISR